MSENLPVIMPDSDAAPFPNPMMRNLRLTTAVKMASEGFVSP